MSVSHAFDDLLAAVTARGLPHDLLAPGRSVTSPDVPAPVAAVYARADGMAEQVWRKRYWGKPRKLMSMAEFLSELRAREFIAMAQDVASYLDEDDDLFWDDTWWPLLTASPKDVVAVDRVTGEVWFSYSEAEIKEVIALNRPGSDGGSQSWEG